MSVRDFVKDLEKDSKIKNKSHLNFNFSNLDEEEFMNSLSLIFKTLKNCDIDNVSFSFSCDYWESDLLDEEDF